MKKVTRKGIIYLLIIIIFSMIYVCYLINTKNEDLQQMVLQAENKNNELIVYCEMLENENQDLETYCETLKKDYNDSEIEDFFTVVMEPEFFEKIHNNPIDIELKTFESIEVYNTYEVTEVFKKRCKVWDLEIENVITKLENYLVEDDYQLLLDGQVSWDLYIDSSYDLEIEFLNQQTEYTDMGSMYHPQPMHVKAEKTRARAIELLSYLFLLTGEVEFANESPPRE